MKKYLSAFTCTLFVHSFAGWFYIAGNAVFHPETLPLPLTHLLDWPREDTFGILCFGISLVSLFVFMLVRECKESR